MTQGKMGQMTQVGMRKKMRLLGRFEISHGKGSRGLWQMQWLETGF